jgi:hypothetical protein
MTLAERGTGIKPALKLRARSSEPEFPQEMRLHKRDPGLDC